MLVAFTGEGHFLLSFHAWLDVDCYLSLLSLKCTAIQAEHLLFIRDGLARSVIHLLQCDISSNVDVLSRLRLGFLKTAIGRAKVTAFNLEVRARHLSQVSAEIVEGVRL